MAKASIRPARTSDFSRIMEMGGRFLSEPPYNKLVEQDQSQMGEVVRRLMNGDGEILVVERDDALTGMIGFFVYPHFISGKITAAEVFWWVEPEFRGDGVRLLHKAEETAKFLGAEKMQMVAPTEKVENVYQRLGYEYVESAYQRSL